MITTIPSAFGKVPFRGDFVRIGERAPELLELDGWFQEGIHRAQQALGKRWNDVFDALPTLAFVYSSRETGLRYAGVIRASQDRTGRRYPITVGCRSQARACGLGELAVVLEPFLSDAQATVEDLSLTNSELFEHRIEALRRDIDPSGAIPVFRTGLQAKRAQSLWGEGSETSLRREVMLSELRDLSTNPAKLALHLPVSGQIDETAFWLEVVEHWLPAGSPMTLALWTPGVPGSLRLLYDRLVARYFEPMMWPGGDSDYEYNLMHTGPQRAASLERAHAAFGRIDLDQSSLAELKRQLAEVRVG